MSYYDCVSQRKLLKSITSLGDQLWDSKVIDDSTSPEFLRRTAWGSYNNLET